MTELSVTNSDTLPALIDRASSTLMSAKTSAEVLEARDVARMAYDAAKSVGRMAKAKKAHDDVIAAVYRAQADALLIESRAKARLADEYDSAQERGEVAGHGGTERFSPNVEASNVGEKSKATASELGLRRDEIHEARKLRDAELKEPGVTQRVLNEIVERGEEPTKAKLKAELKIVPKASEPKPEPDNPVEAKLRREFRALTDEAQEDDYVGINLDLIEAKATIKKLESENRRLKDLVKSFDGDQAETIRRQAQIIRHKESEMYRANDKADRALARAKHLERELNEYKRHGIAV